MTLLRSLLLAILVLLACSAFAGGAEISAFAASSLSGALQEIARSYETRQPAEKVALNFAGSQTLATQIEQGAPADMIISADWRIMERLQGRGLVDEPQPLLYNRLVLAARPGLTPPLTRVADLARPGLLLAIGNRQVPIGSYTRQLFANLAADPDYGPALLRKIEKNVVSEESRVKAIVAKLLLGEADAGILYRSDLTPGKASRLTAIPLPAKHNPLASYPVAKVTQGSSRSDDFIAFLRSNTAREIFLRNGFLSETGK